MLRVLVKAGDTLAKDQPVLELETDKATIEVPSSVAGTVKEIKVKAGDKVKVGQAILSVDNGAGAAVEGPRSRRASRGARPPIERSADTAAKGRAPASSTEGAGKQPPRSVGGEAARPTTMRRTGARRRLAGTEQSRGHQPRRARSGRAAGPPPDAAGAAAPSVRRMARELGVDINDVPGSGPDGRISSRRREGARAKRLVDGPAKAEAPPAEPLPDFSRWGEIERQPMRAVRRKTAEHLTAAWTTIPHVTQHDLADITALEELRKRYAKQAEAAGGNLTVTAIAVKVVASALKVFPQFNASIDLAAEEIIYKKYVNIGVAVDTDRGLLVPVIRDADTKNIMQISVELSQLAEKARTRKITLERDAGRLLQHLEPGRHRRHLVHADRQRARSRDSRHLARRMEPVFKDGAFVPRLMLPLSLSYDHRVIDGADGIRFLRWIAEALEQPFLLALRGETRDETEKRGLRPSLS